MKFCINTRDEIIIINLDEVACFQANGNYTNICYMSGQKMTVSIGISKMEQLISKLYPKGEPSTFLKVGRSLLINQKYLCHIDTLKQKVVLSDYKKSLINISIGKNLLKKLKVYIGEQYKAQLK